MAAVIYNPTDSEMRKEILLILFFVLFSAVFHADKLAEMEKQIDQAPGKKRLTLILSLFPLLPRPEFHDRHARLAEEALALSRIFHDRRAEATSQKWLGHIQYIRGKNYTRSLDYFFQARECYQRLSDPDGAAEMNQEISNIFRFCLNDNPHAFIFLDKAIAILRRSRNKPLLFRALTNRADLCEKLGQYPAALTFQLEAYELSREIKNPARTALSLVNLGKLHMIIGDTDLAREKLIQAKELYESLRWPFGVARACSKLAEFYSQMKEDALAVEYGKKALQLLQECCPAEYMQISEDMTILGSIYLKTGQYLNALQYFQEALAIQRKDRQAQSIARTLLSLGKTLLAMGDLERAEKCFQESLGIAKKNQFVVELKEIYLALSDFHTRKGDDACALSFIRRHGQLQENILGKAASKAIRDIILRYEGEKIRADLIQKDRTRNRILLAAFLAVSSSLALLGIRFRSSSQKEANAQSLIILKDRELWEHQTRFETLQSEMERLFARKKYEKSNLTSNLARELLQRVESLISREKIFLDSELSLKSLAERMRVNTSYLSQTINEYAGRKFKDYINYLRVQESMKLLAMPENRRQGIIDIAFASGFNSLISFNRAFRKYNQTSPEAYRQAAAENAFHLPK